MSWHPRKQRRVNREQNCTMFGFCHRYTAQVPPLTGQARNKYGPAAQSDYGFEPGRRFSDVDDRKHGERGRDPGEILTVPPAAVVIHAEMMALKSVSEGL